MSDRKTTSQEIFDEVHKLISDLLNTKMTPEIEARILEERAEKLQKSNRVEDTGEKINVLIFQLADEYLAMESHYIFEVRPISEITPVPCTPDFVLGITNIRGAVYSVIDIRDTFGFEDRTVTENSMYIMISWNNVELCLLVDAVHEKISLPRQEIKSMAVSSKEALSNFVTGFFMYHQKKVTLLNWDNYLSQSNIIVNEEF